MNKIKSYAGIGARNTPDNIIELMEKIGTKLALDGYILRSGAAIGADSAFEAGCDKVKGNKEIFLPWKGFENSKSNLIVENKKAFEIAEKYHEYWDNLADGAKKLQARNSLQILGKNLDDKTKFVICWTKDAKQIGGTGQALRLSNAYNIPIFNLADKRIYDRLETYVSK